MFCTKGALTSYLRLKWCGPGALWSALCLCHLGAKAGALVRTNQGCSSENCIVATLVG